MFLYIPFFVSMDSLFIPRMFFLLSIFSHSKKSRRCWTQRFINKNDPRFPPGGHPTIVGGETWTQQKWIPGLIKLEKTKTRFYCGFFVLSIRKRHHNEENSTFRKNLSYFIGVFFIFKKIFNKWYKTNNDKIWIIKYI